MDAKTYVKMAIKTESNDYGRVAQRLTDLKTLRLLHSFIGICTEGGELQDALKKQIIYGKPLDETNVVEELGDLMWYVAIACDTLGVNLEDVMEKNIAKLKARYGDKFTEEAALNRDLTAEREILEKK